MPNRRSPGCTCCGSQSCLILEDDFERDELGDDWFVFSGDWYILDGELTVSVAGILLCEADDSALPTDRFVSASFKGSEDDVFTIAGVEVKIGASGYIGRQGYTPAASCAVPISADEWHVIEIYTCGPAGSLYSGKILLDGEQIAIAAWGSSGAPNLVATTIASTLYFDDIVWRAQNIIGETQTITFSPFWTAATGGSLDLTYKGDTQTFAYDPFALGTLRSDVETWLQGIDGPDLTVSLFFGSSLPLVVVWGFDSGTGLWSGENAGIDEPLIVGDGSALLGNVDEEENELGFEIVIEETQKGRTCPDCCQCQLSLSCEWTSITVDISGWTDDTFLGSALNGTYTLDVAEDQDACGEEVACSYGCPCCIADIGVELLLADPPDEGDYIEYRYTTAAFCGGNLVFHAGEYRLNGGSWTTWTPEVSGDYSAFWGFNMFPCDLGPSFELTEGYLPPSIGSGDVYFEGS